MGHGGGPGGETLRRAWATGAGPGARRLVVDVDSTICAVVGKLKQGAPFGYTPRAGLPPAAGHPGGHRRGAARPAAQRLGQHRTGARRFIEELVARVRRAGASGEIVMRFDSGFWSNDTISALGRLDVRYTMAVRTGNAAVARAIAAIAEPEWADIDYTPDGQAQVAECT